MPVDKHTDKIRKQISESMKGNKNAEKWTKELVCDILKAMWSFAREPIEVMAKTTNSLKTGEKTEHVVKSESIERKTHLKASLLIEFDIMYPKWFAYIADKFKEDETVLNLLSCIDMICEVNTYNDAANKATDSTMAKMNLSHHYGWADTSNLNIKKEGKSDEDLQKEIEEYEKRNKK